MASKLAKMPAASSDANKIPGLVNESPDTLSRIQLVLELVNQWASLRKDMSALIQEVVKPLQTLVDALNKSVNNFDGRPAAAESLAGKTLNT